MESRIYHAVNAKYDIPPEIRPTLEDFKSMVNWLISWGLYVGRSKNPDREKYWVETRRGLRFNSYQMCEDTTASSLHVRDVYVLPV